MSNIADAFDHGKAFIAFITCGDPDLATTAAAVREAAANGADLIELGIPFSDPTAEGPVIQEANVRALAGGVTTDKVFELVRELRRDVTIPLVFMTYANVVFSYGSERFLARCREVGIDGLILPDVPFEEREELLLVLRPHGLGHVPLIAPNTPIERVVESAKDIGDGFLYVITVKGTTGARTELPPELSGRLDAIRAAVQVPVAAGFGVSTREQANMISRHADGFIVGSALVKRLGEKGSLEGDVLP